ncbi:MAG: magnesium transporter [Alphaproteobacteria bacterium]|nr:magnesium transporter [Alphaproteobacteria bacterium]
MAEGIHTPEKTGNTHSVLTDEFLLRVFDAMDANNSELLLALLDPLGPEDFADLVHFCSVDQRELLFGLTKTKLNPDVLPLLDETVREDVVEQMAPGQLAEAITNLETDDAVEVIENLDRQTQREVLSALPAEERDALRTALSYPEESAGRLMQRELLAVPDDWNSQQCTDYIRSRSELPEAFYDIFVVDNESHTLGSVPLHRLLTCKTATPIKDIMDEQSQRMAVTMDQKEVAYLFQRYGLVSAPVEDEQRRLVGMITIDDVIDIIEERATEELVHLSGVSEPDFYRDIVTTTRSRFTWLFVNLLTAMLASWVISFFEGTLQSIVALAVLMPIVASQGGNAGTQTLAVAVRGLALRELTSVNAMGFLAKEASVGAFNGLLFAGIISVCAGFWYHNWIIALVIALAMIINMIAAGLAGAFIPLVLNKFKIDPAISSSALVTTVTDVCGYLSFLGLATLFLMK